MSRAHRTWLVLLALVTIGIVALQWNWKESAPESDDGSAAALRTWGRLVVGVHEVEKIAKTEGQTEKFLDELEAVELGDADRLRRAVVEAEVRGPEPALELLGGVKGEAEERALLERRYRGESLTAEESARLVDRFGWFGRLSNVYGLPDDQPDRQELLESARGAAVVMLTFTTAAIPALLLGFVLLIVFVVRASTGKIRARFALHDEGSGDLVWLQTVVIGLTILLALLIGLFESVPVPRVVQPWLVLLALFWPFVRGMGVREWTGGLGLLRGEGLFREVRAGVLGYIGGLPVILLGFWMTARLSQVTGLQPDHPIREVLAGPVPVWALFVSAVVWPALVEELLFRGAFYRYLRPAVSVVGATLITGLVFAALHPQGLAGIPVLLSISVVIAALREWRGSIVASMTAHAVHNGWLLVVGVNVVG